ncbi:MAG: hypothetical protein AB7F74_00370 [Parvibaculaceae bacterium]
MSKLMIILGIIVAAAGAVIGALIYVSPGQMQVLGLTPEVAAVLLVGGLGLIGLGGVIGALDKSTAATRGLREWLAGQDNGQAAPGASPGVVSEFSTSTIAPPPFPVPPAEPPSASKLDALLKESKAETNRAVAESQETVAAIDKAKNQLEEVFKTPSELAPPPPPPPPVVEPAAEPPAETVEVVEAVDESEDTQLFVVEERLIRGRPARVLSDGTVEAETDDGWMRFENLEHLEEYLDAMSPGQA